jgi:Tfp pilus assembly protein PilF
LATGAAAALCVSLASLTMVRNVDWQTPLALWRDSVAKQPRSALAHGNLALSCLVVGDRQCARTELETAVALDPLRADFAQALRDLPH